MKNILSLIILLISFTSLNAGDKKGTFKGLLIEKGDKWIKVIKHGEKKPMKLIPEWIGKSPKDGGGLKKDTLKKIKKLIVPNVVEIKWKFEEHNRVLDVTMIEPKKKKGIMKGEVTNLGDRWFEIINTKTKSRERFFPLWLKGGLDKEIITKIKSLKKGQKVTVKWKYDERNRALSIK
ncbi:MAG: hypothetical protein COA79_05410 [Planctomycetota bacterium]|nr:MAG: hypothetical protein COA79_05410 [Planctomycetota bacterium]